MNKTYSIGVKRSLLLLLIECVAALCVIFFVNGAFYNKLMFVGMWMAMILPITLGFIYASIRNVTYPIGLALVLTLAIFFYNIFLSDVRSIGIALTLFNFSVVLPYLLWSPRESGKASRKTILIGFLISAVYVFAYSALHYTVLINYVE
jgi:hypothetical protein